MEHPITVDPKVLLGKAVVAGTRVTVEHILSCLGAGETVKQLLDAHRRLTREGVQAALSYAVNVLRSDIVYPTGDSAA